MFVDTLGHTACLMTEQLLLQVPNAHIYRLDLIPDIDQGLLKINVQGSQSALGGQLQVSI